MYEEEVNKMHKYFLSQNHKFNHSLEKYKLLPAVNRLFYGYITYDDIIRQMGNLIDENGPYRIDRGSSFYQLLEKLKSEYIGSFNLRELDAGFKWKLKDDIKTYRVGVDTEGIFKGYLSTSLSQHIPYDFLNKDCIYYVINIPKGTPYVYLESARNGNSGIVSNFPYEYEILLPRGATYETLKYEKRRIPNPHYRYEKENTHIDIIIKTIKITGFKPMEPKLMIMI